MYIYIYTIITYNNGRLNSRLFYQCCTVRGISRWRLKQGDLGKTQMNTQPWIHSLCHSPHLLLDLFLTSVIPGVVALVESSNHLSDHRVCLLSLCQYCLPSFKWINLWFKSSNYRWLRIWWKAAFYRWCYTAYYTHHIYKAFLCIWTKLSRNINIFVVIPLTYQPYRISRLSVCERFRAAIRLS